MAKIFSYASNKVKKLTNQELFDILTGQISDPRLQNEAYEYLYWFAGNIISKMLLYRNIDEDDFKDLFGVVTEELQDTIRKKFGEGKYVTNINGLFVRIYSRETIHFYKKKDKYRHIEIDNYREPASDEEIEKIMKDIDGLDIDIQYEFMVKVETCMDSLSKRNENAKKYYAALRKYGPPPLPNEVKELLSKELGYNKSSKKEDDSFRSFMSNWWGKLIACSNK